MCVAIILASGKGKRMGGDKNKVFLTIGRRPILYHTVSIFEKNRNIKKIIIAARENDVAEIKKIVHRFGFKKVEDIVLGGSERQESAYRALQHLGKKIGKGDDPVVIFHNGANPFVTSKEINESITAAKKYGACVVAHPTKDTVKEIGSDGIVVRTLERKKLWSMQTPQAILFHTAYAAFSKAQKDGFIGTDDVSLVERMGKKVMVIQASIYNFKITHPIDLELAKIIYKKLKGVSR